MNQLFSIKLIIQYFDLWKLNFIPISNGSSSTVNSVSPSWVCEQGKIFVFHFSNRAPSLCVYRFTMIRSGSRLLPSSHSCRIITCLAINGSDFECEITGVASIKNFFLCFLPSLIVQSIFLLNSRLGSDLINTLCCTLSSSTSTSHI